MKSTNSIWQRLTFTLALLGTLSASAVAQVFTVQVGSPSAPAMPLVNQGDAWRYHKGTNAPVPGWQTNADSTLDQTWLTGNGGLGYSTDTPNEVSLCQTLIGDMFNSYTTLYARRTFVVTNVLDPLAHLQLTMDYDDAFVAYLNGVEVARSPNAPGAVGVEPAYTATTSGNNHESSRGTSTPVNPPTTFNLGTVAAHLQPGTNHFAILGVNGAIGSSDFILIANLVVEASSSTVANGAFFSIVRSNATVLLSGTNTLASSARVLVDGVDAAFDPGSGAWSKTIALTPGLNRPLIQAVDAVGVPLFITNTLIVSEMTTTAVGGAITSDTTWSPAMGIIHATNSVFVAPGVTLDLQPGTVVLVGAGFSLHTTNGTINALGTEKDIVALLPADGTANWNEVAADGATSFLTLRHVETIAAAVKMRAGATGWLEDSFFHDYKNGSVPIGGCTGAKSVTVRGCHFRVYHETLWQDTLMTIEESLFELANNPSSDALDFDGVPVGSIIRRCTFRHGPQSNTDAIDIGPTTSGIGSTNTIIENCLMFDFPFDKGVSIGEGSYGIEVRNCLMYGNDSGVAVKDSPGGKPPCTAIIHDCTIVNNDFGYRCYNKSMPASATNGGQITNSYNNIVWNNGRAFELLNDAILVADHTDFSHTNWAGTGNFEADPLFLNPAVRDYRLATNSPCLGAGRDGATLGAKFPVGAAMALSHPRIESIERTGETALLKFWVDSEKTYSLLRSTNVSGGAWEKVADAFPYPTSRLLTVTNSLASPSTHYYRLVTPRQ